MKKDIGKVIAKHRKAMKLSQIDLARQLAEHNIVITNAGISAWEKGNTTPSAEALLTVCEILKISDIYTEFIGENPLDPFKELNSEGTQKALEYIDLLKKSGDYKKHSSDIIDIKPRLMKIALISASAGTGNLLDEENFEMMEITEPVPKKADFGVYITGDSMEPRFHDEELVVQNALDAVVGTVDLGDLLCVERGADDAVGAGVDDRGGTAGLTEDAGAD